MITDLIGYEFSTTKTTQMRVHGYCAKRKQSFCIKSLDSENPTVNAIATELFLKKLEESSGELKDLHEIEDLNLTPELEDKISKALLNSQIDEIAEDSQRFHRKINDIFELQDFSELEESRNDE